MVYEGKRGHSSLRANWLQNLTEKVDEHVDITATIQELAKRKTEAATRDKA